MNVYSMLDVLVKEQVKSMWISANAGSGKTTELTQRVVRLLLAGVMPERIVCITYTKAAAGEMRSRVLDMLRELLLSTPDTCRALIKKITGHEANDDEVLHARSLFGSVLDSPSGGLQLTTIHGFCQNILRRFPMEAGLAPQFTVLDDGAAEELLHLSRRRLQERFESGDAWLTQSFSCIGERSGETRFDDLMADVIKKRECWDVLWRGQPHDCVRERIYKLHGLTPEVTKQALAKALCAAPSESDAAILRAYLPAWVSNKKETEKNYGSGCAAWLEASADERVERVEALLELILKKDGDERVAFKKMADVKKDAQLGAAVERFVAAVLDYRDKLAALACAEETFAIAVLARELNEQYRRAKEDIRALDYDDLIARTVQLCSHPETIGWVMTKLDNRIDHLMLDEAQDTSASQWQLVRTLVEELIASNGGIGSDGLPRSLLVVGDEKQSIYSFQGAAPEQFARNAALFDAMLDGSDAPLEHKTLDTSYRSAEAVLTLVDAVANQPDIAPALTASGSIQKHKLYHDAAEGLVALHPLIVAPEKETLPPLTIPTEYFISKSAAQLLADHIALTIEGWLQKQRLLASKGRPVRAGDILILVRGRNALFLPLIRALQRRDIPVAGLDRLTLSKHLAVRDLLALIRWFLNNADDLSLAQVLRSPLIGMSDESLRALAHGRKGMLFAQTNEPLLARWIDLKHASPYDFLTDVLEGSGCRKQFAKRFGEEVHEVLDELKSQAALMPANMQPSLANFHDWLDGSTRTIKRDQETSEVNQVRIMTVHGAKGLEAPIVIMADTVDVPTTQHEKSFFVEMPTTQPLPVIALSAAAKLAPVLVGAKRIKKDAILAEYYRLLYVALTRAKFELHVFGSARSKGEAKPESWYGIVERALRACRAKSVEGILTLRDERPDAAKQDEHVAKAAPVMPSWVTRQAPQPVYKKQPMSPSQMVAVDPSPYAKSGVRDAKERGVRIHRILELLRADSDAMYIEKLVRHVGPDWSAKEQTAIASEVAAIFKNEHWLWEYDALPEANIAGTIIVDGEKVAVFGQMDRMMRTDREIIILDYKTGSHVPAEPHEISMAYILQLKTYKTLLEQLSPSMPIRCAILWTHGPQLMWMDDIVESTVFANQNVMLKTPLAS